MQVYLDNSATTRCFDEVIEYMDYVNREAWGNPSSMHDCGMLAEKELRCAKDIIAKNMKVQIKEIYFTSGGTESDNLALIGCAMANKRSGMHLITSKVEHPAILETMKYLEDQGFAVTYLDVDSAGRVRVEDVKSALREDTILVSIMHINNEIGSLMPIEEIGKAIKEYNRNILFHVDAVQSFGKQRIYPKRMNIDLLSVSGHKIHGPKGVGILYIDEKVKIHPIIFGGGQQKNMRSGTENVPGIAGIAKACEIIYKEYDENIERLYSLKEYFISEVSRFDGVRVNGIPGKSENNMIISDEKENLAELVRMSAPHVMSVSFKGVRAEVLLHTLESKGIYVSSGSACATNKPATSATLLAIGVEKEYLDSTIRFSMSVHTTREELDYTLNVLKSELPMLRKYARH